MTLVPDPDTGPRIVLIPRLAAGGRWRIEAMRSLREPVLFWFTQGAGRITVSGTTRGYGAHNAVFVPAGVMHGFEMTGRVFGTAAFFGRNHGLRLPEEPVHLRIRDTAAQQELGATLDAAQRELDAGRPGAVQAAQHHLGLAVIWLDRQIAMAEAASTAPAPAPQPGRAPDRAPELAGAGATAAAARRLTERYSRLLERDYRSGMAVADFAAALGVTPTHLTRACKAASGRAAHALLQDRVLYEARRLLSETDMPVMRVAETLGYRSPAYFARAFHQKVGITPSDFRRRG